MDRKCGFDVERQYFLALKVESFSVIYSAEADLEAGWTSESKKQKQAGKKEEKRPNSDF